MDKKIAGLLGAVAGLATIGTAQAAINPAAVPDALQASSQVSSYADLLTPIAHPIALLKADDSRRPQKPAAQPSADFQLAANHHHHHHHHRHYSRNYHHHHHYDHR